MTRGKHRKPRHEGIDPPRLTASIRVPTATEVDLRETFAPRPRYQHVVTTRMNLEEHLNLWAKEGYRVVHVETERITVDRQWVAGYRVLLERR